MAGFLGQALTVQQPAPCTDAPSVRPHPRAPGAIIMAMGLSEAAQATGVNRSTIYRAWKSGRMSATRLETGQIEVDPAELFRVFPPIALQEAPNSALHGDATPGAIALNALRTSALEVEVKLLREMLDAMRSDRDAWREQAGKVVAALPPPAPARRPWWRRLAG